MDFTLATHEEICQEIGRRLRIQRLAQALSQEELAVRAGVSTGTVKNIEGRGRASLESVIRLAVALGLADELAPLFLLRVSSIADMQQAEAAERQRAPRQRRK